MSEGSQKPPAPGDATRTDLESEPSRRRAAERTEEDQAVTLSTAIGLRYAIGFADTETIVIDVTDGTGLMAGEPRTESSLFHQIGLHLGTAVRWR